MTNLSELPFSENRSNGQIRPWPLPIRIKGKLVLRDRRQGRVLRAEPRPVSRVDGRVLLLDPDDRGNDGGLGADALPLDDHLLRPLGHRVCISDRL